MTTRRVYALAFTLIFLVGMSQAENAMAALDDLLPPVQTETERFPPAEEDEKKAQEEESEEEPEPEPTPVKPEIEAPEEPLVSSLPAPQNADIQQQIQKLREALDSRQHALSISEQRLAYAESLRTRLDNEYESFELRLERAGLNLTDDYANLLRQRLERLRNQTIAAGLTKGISAQLSAAREEQLRLEEFEAVIEPDDDARGRLEVKRVQLLRQLHGSVTKHIEVLNEYYNIVVQLQDRLESYQTLLQQRLFWLPSTNKVNLEMVGQIYRGVVWFVSSFKLPALKDAVQASVDEHWPLLVLLSVVVVVMAVRRRRLRKALIDTGYNVGNVRQDRWNFTFSALVYSFLLALPGVFLLTLGHLLLESGNSFLHALSKGLSNAAFVTLLLRSVYTVAYTKGLGERHFQWNPNTLRMIRKQIPILLAVLIPIIIIMPTMATKKGAVYSDSLGRFLFMLASFALAYFAQQFMTAVRKDQSTSQILRVLHWIAVAMPLALAFISLWGYHYTAVRFEGLMFISLCWVAFVILLHYLGLRSLAVRERRMALKRVLETREAERKLAETREAAESSGEGVPMSFDSPRRDINEISQQSETLLKIISLILAAVGLWMLWDNVFPALGIFDDITLWTINTGIEGQDPVPINLGDLMVALAIGAGTVLAARNLPGTLEVVFLSRLNLEPGVGYAITTLATYIIVFIGIVAALAGLGFQWSKLQWLVAALGVGLGFGLQEIVANFVSGIILLFERPIRVGDTVTIGGITGTVSRIRIRATTLVDWDRKEQIIPNKTFVTQDLTNWTLSDPITRVIVRVGVAYGSDVDKVQDLLHKVAVKNERVVEEPAPAVFCVELGESRIDFEVRVFVRDVLDFMPLSHELHSAITRALKEAGIEIPFPQRDIHIRTEPEK
ncbi:mechanosensitive ion channel domain-containing protein [Marinobacter sp. F4218]|uniref:mechanosensitive ion channel domain-containing protein n=1 Tax=Marinobacter sp. F4218 TaxID=2862868 RepID=UPI001C633566|nr:mechanosensitive ion channel domain-containing protein [Marinobacter sp. F4218]MBW7469853.1 mechanosensitive ion channel [Marinobacter sp. F4218]